MRTTSPLSLLGTLAALAIAAPDAATATSAPTEPACTIETPDRCGDGVSAGVTGGETLRTAAERLTPARRAEAREEEPRASNRGRGRAAGETPSSWAVWGSGGYADYEGTPVFGNMIARYDARLVNGLAGADVLIADRLVLGAALGYGDNDADTAYNGGEISTRGATVAPYALLVLNDYLSIDLSAGYSALDNEQRRIDPADSAPGAPVYLRATFDSSRWFVSTNLNGTYTRGPWVFGAQAGYLKTEEDQDGYTESGGSSARTVRDRTLSLAQGHLSVDVGYGVGGWEPYARVGYYHDFARDDGQGVGGLPGASVRTGFDRDAWRLAGGVRYFGPRLDGSLEVQTEQGRDDFDSASVLLSVRATF